LPGHHRNALEMRRLVLLAVISAVIGGTASVLVFARLSNPSKLHILAEIRQQQLAQQDADNLNRIGLALNEYAVDHSGNYPTSLGELGSPYLNSQLYNPSSNPAQPYNYDYPAVDKDWGSFDVIDNGSFDISQLKLSNGIGGPPCRPVTCKYIIYTESAGLIGYSTVAATPKPAAPTSASDYKRDLSTTEYGKFRDLSIALNEYAAAHFGYFPPNLDALQLKGEALAWSYVPGSKPARWYTYHHPAAYPKWGSYDIVDEGSADPSSLKLADGVGGPPCSPATCRYVIDTESVGLIGSRNAPPPRPADEVQLQLRAEEDALDVSLIASAVDDFYHHKQRFPANLAQLPKTTHTPYLPEGTVVPLAIPQSNPSRWYSYQHPAVDSDWGTYDVADDGSFDPSRLRLRNGIGGPLCRPNTCKYVVYTAAGGLIGSPIASPTAKPIPTYTFTRQSAYVNRQYGISFRYPTGYVLTIGDSTMVENGLGYMGPIPLGFEKDGGVRIVTVEIPPDAYPRTDFVNAFFTVNVHQRLTRSECSEISLRDTEHVLHKVINGVAFFGVRADWGAMNRQFAGAYYHGFSGADCYELGYGLATAGSGLIEFTEAGNKRVTLEEIEPTFEQVLQSVIISRHASKPFAGGSTRE
jgi:hypothetical protein